MIFKVMETHKLIEMKKYKLGELIDVTRGMSLPGDKYAESGDLIRLTLGNFNLQGNGFKPNTSKTDIYFTGSVKEEFIMKKGDIITPLTEQTYGLLGSTARIPESGKYIQSQDVALIKSKSDKLHEDFCYYLISSPSVRKQLGAAAQQTKIRHTSPDKIKDCEVIIPEDVNQQIKITNLINTLEDKITLNNKTNTELENMAKTIYDYWFTQSDFPDKNGHPYKSSGGQMVYNETLKREIPVGWEVGNIFKVAKLLSGGTPSKKKAEYWNGEIPFFGPTDHQNTMFQFSTAETITDAGLNNCSSYLMKKNTIIITARGSVGKLVIVGKPMAMNQSCYAFESLNDNYEYLYFLTKQLIENLKIKSSGSVFKSIISADIENSDLIIGDNKTISEYTNLVRDIFLQIKKNQEENEELTKLRDYLLPLLMNGQIEVK